MWARVVSQRPGQVAQSMPEPEVQIPLLGSGKNEEKINRQVVTLVIEDMAKLNDFYNNKDDFKISNTFNEDNTATLYNGDCLDFLKTIPDGSFQLIITSPPYNLGKEYEKKMDIDEYVLQQTIVIDECVRTLKPRGSICWEIGNFVENGEIIPLDILLYRCFTKHGLKLRNRIIWHFGHGLHCSKRFSGRYESIMWFSKNGDYVFNLDPIRIPQKYPGKKFFRGKRIGEYSCNPLGKNPTDVWDIPNVKSNHIEKTCHPCQFPIMLVQRLILSLSNEGDIVFDPFLGVGSTAAAAILNKRKAAGCELVSKYYDIACDRVTKAYKGELRYREEKPVYQPDENLTLAKNPFIN